MVESETTKASEMCMHITAENKWFVTGTPIQREISGEWIFNLLHMCVHTPRVHMYCAYTECMYSTCMQVRMYVLHMFVGTYLLHMYIGMFVLHMYVRRCVHMYSTCMYVGTYVCTPHVCT